MEQELLDILCKYFSTATGNVSKCARAWSISIIMPAMAWLIMNDVAAPRLLISAVAIALISLLIDNFQYAYTSICTKRLIDKVNDGLITQEALGRKMKSVHNITFWMVLSKFFLLSLSTVALIVFMFMMY